MVFVDRRDAGRRLGALLADLAAERPVVIALPRGGVPVALEVARALRAPLDILAVRKIGAPGNPELGVGAIAEDGNAVLDQELAARVGMTQRLLDETVATESAELRRRVEAYRDGRAAIDVRGRTVIVIDDGLATGLTDLAAVRALRGRGAARIVVAVPVGSPQAVELVGREADAVVCHTTPDDFRGVGRWYDDFRPVSDAEVLTGLATVTPASGPPSEQRGERAVEIDVGEATLAGDLAIPDNARGLVIFAHGSGSSRSSPRNREVAAALQRAGLATLLFDLLTDAEAQRRELVFDIPLLTRRLELVTGWALRDPVTSTLAIGYFGASTGAGAALRAAAGAGDAVRAVVSRGGRPDLAADRLQEVTAPTLLIVGGDDREVLELNRFAGSLLRCPNRIAVVPGAGHLFEEPGALEAVALLAAEWFTDHLEHAPQTVSAATA